MTNQRTYFRQQQIKRQSLYNHCHLAAKRALRLQMKPVLQSVLRGESIEIVVASVHEEPIEQGLLSIYTKVVPTFALLSYRNLLSEKKDFLTDFLESEWIARARYYVQTTGQQRIKKITETTKTVVRDFVEAATQRGWGSKRTATELSAYTRFLNKSRAVVIAVTELVSSSNLGSIFGAKATRKKLNKVWLAKQDSRTRHSHQVTHGQTVDIDDTFKIGIYRLNHPGDSSLGAPTKEVMRCRCVVSFQQKK